MHILRFHELASAHCDGLHPDMARLLEELEVRANNRQIVEIRTLKPGAPVQSGPSPACRQATADSAKAVCDSVKASAGIISFKTTNQN